MKKIIIVTVIIIISLFVIGLIKDQVIKSVITVVSTQITGAPVHIDGFSLGVFSQSVRITGFKMYNPAGFSKDILIDLEKVYVECDLGAIFKKKLHITNVEIELKQMGLEKNKEGKLNVDSLKVVEQANRQEGKAPEQMPIQIDMLKLGIGKVFFRDYSVAKEPVVKVYDINIHKNYKNISSAQQLAALIMAEPMKAAGIQGVAIYGVAMLSGVAVLPVAVAVRFAGRDSVEQDIRSPFDNVYNQSKAILQQKAKINRDDRPGGIISATINSVQITVRIRKKTDSLTQITVSARKYLFPKPEIAGGILYEISEKIK
ncbi:MAG: hypothetical protein ABH882_04825 [Candidatus Omnitrophota bacterium]|nr:hypothetical protein [Candidatus Omnitrophota bacterium]MBU1929641.1 hypothetical protein [Candidatus Omnitrophota bacterium]MBU2035403.1 hypothetical protein [Candidatus Omnitrophota bacterium]MBU2221937.1 hypothetical protein [Candidatus Omnitrophota bacterium]